MTITIVAVHVEALLVMFVVDDGKCYCCCATVVKAVFLGNVAHVFFVGFAVLVVVVVAAGVVDVDVSVVVVVVVVVNQGRMQ